LSLGSLVEVAAIAEEFKQFPEESHQLLERCIDELANVVKHIPEFVATNMESGHHGTVVSVPMNHQIGPFSWVQISKVQCSGNKTRKPLTFNLPTP
jgi:hypothetical protein